MIYVSVAELVEAIMVEEWHSPFDELCEVIMFSVLILPSTGSGSGVFPLKETLAFCAGR